MDNRHMGTTTTHYNGFTNTGDKSLHLASLFIVAGIFPSFWVSPYSFTPHSILIKIAFVVTFRIGMDLCRAYQINNFTKSSLASSQRYRC